MASFIPFNRDQAFLLPPDLKSWLPDDDLAHFVVAARGGGSWWRRSSVCRSRRSWCRHGLAASRNTIHG